MEAEGKTINHQAWSLQDWKPNSPGPSHCLLLPMLGPHPLHFPHVLESFSSEGGGVMVRPLSGPGRRLFSQLLVASAQCEGEQLSQASGMCSGAEKPRQGREGPAAPHPGPLTLSCRGGEEGSWELGDS